MSGRAIVTAAARPHGYCRSVRRTRTSACRIEWRAALAGMMGTTIE